MKKLFFYLTAVGAAFFACNKAKLDESSANTINPALSVSSDFQNNDGLTQALARIEALPQQERTRFTDVGKEFVADFIYSFDIVYDKAQNKYAVENIKKMYFITEDKASLEHALKYVDVNAAPETSNWSATFGVIAEKSAKNELRRNRRSIETLSLPNNDNFNTSSKTTYIVICRGGSHNGDFTVTTDKGVAGTAAKNCKEGGGCPKCTRAYAVPTRTLNKYDYLENLDKLKNALSKLEELNQSVDIRALEAKLAHSKVEHAIVTEE